MGSGCLSPSPIEVQLTSKLITELHAKDPSASRSATYEMSSSYSAAKQKFFKRASLRKLIDHLSSHRHKIYEAISLNFKICMQSGTEDSWTIGLLILERIISMAATEQTNPSCVLKQKSLNQGSQYQQKRIDSGMTELFTMKTSDKENRRVLVLESSNSAIQQEICSIKFETIVLRMVQACLNQQSLYIESLRILIDYTQVSAALLQSDEQLKELLTSLLDNIRTRYQATISLEAYNRLVSRMKDKDILSLIGHLRSFCKIWLDAKTNIRSARSLTAIARQEEESGFIELIITKFFSSAVQGMDYKGAIKTLMELQDEYNFDLPLQFEALYLKSLASSDLGGHFLKAHFLEMLHYSITGNMDDSQRSILAAVIGSSVIQSKYRNSKEKTCRKNIFQLIQRWVIEKQYIPLQQIIKYHSSLFLYCFAASIQIDKDNQTTRQIFKAIVSNLSIPERIQLVETILEEFQKSQTPIALRSLLLQIGVGIIQPLELVTTPIRQSRFSINSEQLSEEEYLAIFSASTNLYMKLSQDILPFRLMQICELLASACGFLSEASEESQASLIQALLVFCQSMVHKQGIVVSFYHKIRSIYTRRENRLQEAGPFSILKDQLAQLLTRSGYSHINQQEDFQGNIVKETLLDCNNYFRQLLNWEGRSKIEQQPSFQKAKSFIRDSIQVRDEEQSFREVMEMINY